jgi:hypothetical protein
MQKSPHQTLNLNCDTFPERTSTARMRCGDAAMPVYQADRLQQRIRPGMDPDQ